MIRRTQRTHRARTLAAAAAAALLALAGIAAGQSTTAAPSSSAAPPASTSAAPPPSPPGGYGGQCGYPVACSSNFVCTAGSCQCDAGFVACSNNNVCCPSGTSVTASSSTAASASSSARATSATATGTGAAPPPAATDTAAPPPPDATDTNAPPPPPGATAATRTSSSTRATTGTGTATGTGTTGTGTATAAAGTDQGKDAGGGSTGAIAGGVVAGVAVLGIAGVLLWRRNQRKEARKRVMEAYASSKSKKPRAPTRVSRSPDQPFDGGPGSASYGPPNGQSDYGDYDAPQRPVPLAPMGGVPPSGALYEYNDQRPGRSKSTRSQRKGRSRSQRSQRSRSRSRTGRPESMAMDMPPGSMPPYALAAQESAYMGAPGISMVNGVPMQQVGVVPGYPMGAVMVPAGAVAMVPAPGQAGLEPQAHWLFLRVAAPLGAQNEMSVPYAGPGFEVVGRFDPSAPDEMAVMPGDVVEPKEIFRDGWTMAWNQSTGGFGMVPLNCLRLPAAPATTTLEPSSARYVSKTVATQSAVLQERALIAAGQSRVVGRSGALSTRSGAVRSQGWGYGVPPSTASSIDVRGPQVR